MNSKANSEVISKWNQAAWALGKWTDKYSLPFHVLIAEAVDVARFAQRNWEPALGPEGQEIRPGLKAAVGNGTFRDVILTELIELIDALQQAQTSYRLLIAGNRAAPIDRAQFVLSEIRATLEWCFDDDQVTVQDDQLETLTRAHDKAASQDAVAAALFDYAELAEREKSLLEGLGGFEVNLIQEARQLARVLLEQSAGPETIDPRPAEREALELRNRVTTLLSERVARVRAAARFVFRRHPALLKEVGSAYARRRRAKSRKKVNTPAPPAAPTPEVQSA